MRRSVPPNDSLRQAAWILQRCLALGDSIEGVLWLASQMQNVCAGQVQKKPMAMWQAAAHGSNTDLGDGYIVVPVHSAESALAGIPREGFPHSGYEK